MKEDLNKPLYAEYRKQMTFGFDWSVPVTSGGKYFWLADMPFVIIGRVLIAGLAFVAIALLNPFTYSLVTAVISLVVYIIAASFYKYKFVYRFGRFRQRTGQQKDLGDILFSGVGVRIRCFHMAL